MPNQKFHDAMFGAHLGYFKNGDIPVYIIFQGMFSTFPDPYNIRVFPILRSNFLTDPTTFLPIANLGPVRVFNHPGGRNAVNKGQS